ncbi:MAG: hypothetical protein M1816_001455 [Peltula sp. TS41687]|nr:MAG: hypothetical protein M1816_001455 [Peltula sp. TS41687]
MSSRRSYPSDAKHYGPKRTLESLGILTDKTTKSPGEMLQETIVTAKPIILQLYEENSDGYFMFHSGEYHMREAGNEEFKSRLKLKFPKMKGQEEEDKHFFLGLNALILKVLNALKMDGWPEKSKPEGSGPSPELQSTATSVAPPKESSIMQILNPL